MDSLLEHWQGLLALGGSYTVTLAGVVGYVGNLKERVSVQEAKVDDMKTQLDRIESKVDQLFMPRVADGWRKDTKRG